MSEFTKQQDPGERPLLVVSSVPIGPGFTLAGPFTVNANSELDLTITTTPDNNKLGLWNFLHSCAVDVNDFDHRLPNGAALTAAQKGVRDLIHPDFIESSDITNTRVNILRLINDDSSNHDIWVYFKAYTFAAVSGT